MNKLSITLASSIIALFSITFVAKANAGELRDLIDAHSQKLLIYIQENKEDFQANPAKLNSYVRENISEYFFFSYMSRFAAGRYWKKMNEMQKEEYSTLFTDSLIKTYASAIIDFKYEDIFFENEKPGRKKNRFNLTMYVKSKGDKYRVDYEIAKTKKGPKVINVKLEGVSLLINYRKSFGEILSKDGADGLIQFIKDSLKKER